MNKRQFLYSRFPVAELRKVGFFKKGQTVDQMCERVCTFFGIKSIYAYDFMPPFGDIRKTVKADIKTFSIN